MDKTSDGPDHQHSLTADEFNDMVNKIRDMESALGNYKKNIEKSENQTKIIQRRGIWTSKKITKGEKFSISNISVLRPCIGIPANEFTKLLGKRSKKNYSEYSALKRNDF